MQLDKKGSWSIVVLGNTQHMSGDHFSAYHSGNLSEPTRIWEPQNGTKIRVRKLRVLLHQFARRIGRDD